MHRTCHSSKCLSTRFIISALRAGGKLIFLGQNDVMFPQSKHLFAKFQAHPPRRPEEADEVGSVIQFQMSSRERLFEKLMTHPKVDEAHSNAPLSSPRLT